MRGVPFYIEGQSVFFEKSSAEAGKRRRIAGVITTEARDRQQEIIVQKGLDFDSFLTYGWFNDNHSKATDGVVGYPTSVQKFQKGDELPNGRAAEHHCHWAEGYLLEGTPRADAIWTLGKALSKSGGGRGLGFSIEGVIHKRSGPGKRLVTQATVQNCAVTTCPVNPGTKMEMLAKSLVAVSQDDEEGIRKALSMGAPPAGFAAPTGPRQGEGAGQILAGESLESDAKPVVPGLKKRKKKLKKAQAFALLRRGLPASVSDREVLGIVDLAIILGRRPGQEAA